MCLDFYEIFIKDFLRPDCINLVNQEAKKTSYCLYLTSFHHRSLAGRSPLPYSPSAITDRQSTAHYQTQRKGGRDVRHPGDLLSFPAKMFYYRWNVCGMARNINDHLIWYDHFCLWKDNLCKQIYKKGPGSRKLKKHWLRPENNADGQDKDHIIQ